MRKFVLIKEYPGSPEKGMIVELEGQIYVCRSAKFGVTGMITFPRNEIEGFPEFWKEIELKVFSVDEINDAIDKAKIRKIYVNESELDSSECIDYGVIKESDLRRNLGIL
jgi:hypothetical protein